MPEHIFTTLGRFGVVPVVTIDRVEAALPLADALIDGGLPIAEITFRTAAAADAIDRLSRARPELIVGAGTILTRDNLQRAHDCGARFAVAPGLNPELVAEAARIGLPFVPGVATASEIERGLALGCRLLKLFPAALLGGPALVNVLAGPFGHTGVQFMPSGGVTAENAAAYLAAPLVAAVGGTWIARKEALAAATGMKSAPAAAPRRRSSRNRGEAPLLDGCQARLRFAANLRGSRQAVLPRSTACRTPNRTDLPAMPIAASVKQWHLLSPNRIGKTQSGNLSDPAVRLRLAGRPAALSAALPAALPAACGGTNSSEAHRLGSSRKENSGPQLKVRRPDFAIGDAIGEAQPRMLDGVEPGQRGGGDPSRERIAVAPLLALSTDHAGANGAGVFPGPVDPELLGERLIEPTAAAGWKQDEIVAEFARAVDVVRVAGVDPDVQTVAIFEAIIAAPRRLSLAGHDGADREPGFVPTDAHLGAFGAAVERREIGQAIGFAQRGFGTAPASSGR